MNLRHKPPGLSLVKHRPFTPMRNRVARELLYLAGVCAAVAALCGLCWLASWLNTFLWSPR